MITNYLLMATLVSAGTATADQAAGHNVDPAIETVNGADIAAPVPTRYSLESPPIPRNNRFGWITSDDFPSLGLFDLRTGRVGFRLTVDTVGMAIGCDLTQSSGHTSLDTITCATVMRRARFTPAHDANGNVIQGIYHGVVEWRLPFVAGANLISDPRVNAYSESTLAELYSEHFVSAVLTAYPATALRERRSGNAIVNLTLDQRVRVTQCRIEQSSGHADLDARSCALFDEAPTIERRRNTPRTMRVRVVWTLPDHSM